MSNALALIQSWIKESPKKISVIPRSNRLNLCDHVLGISEHSVLGTIFNHTGGLIVGDGLIRHLGGENKYGISVIEANALTDRFPTMIEGILIVAVDIYGGLFGINIDYLGAKPGTMIYLPPDSYSWFPMRIGHSDFVQWSMSDKVTVFYKDYQHLSVQPDVPFEAVMQYMPPLWSVDLTDQTIKASRISVKKLIAIRAGYLAEVNDQFS